MPAGGGLQRTRRGDCGAARGRCRTRPRRIARQECARAGVHVSRPGFAARAHGRRPLPRGADLPEGRSTRVPELLRSPLGGEDIRRLLWPSGETETARAAQPARPDAVHAARHVRDRVRPRPVVDVLGRHAAGARSATASANTWRRASRVCSRSAMRWRSSLRAGASSSRCPAGAMLAVLMGENELAAQLPADVTVAAVNGRAQCVVAGGTEAVAAFERALVDAGHHLQGVADLARLPLADDGPDPGGVRRGASAGHPAAAGDALRFQSHRHLAHRPGGDRSRVLGSSPARGRALRRRPRGASRQRRCQRRARPRRSRSRPDPEPARPTRVRERRHADHRGVDARPAGRADRRRDADDGAGIALDRRRHSRLGPGPRFPRAASCGAADLSLRAATILDRAGRR